MSMRRALTITAAVVAVAAAGVVAIGAARSPDEAQATLPASLERSIRSSHLERSVEVNSEDARKVALDDGIAVFLVPGDDGDACIGLEDGSAACGPAADVAAGRLFLIVVPATGEPGGSAVPATGSATAVIYGYQPNERAARASVIGNQGQVLGSGDVVDGVYRVELTTDARSRRMTQVRFNSDDDVTQAPAPIDLDRPANE